MGRVDDMDSFILLSYDRYGFHPKQSAEFFGESYRNTSCTLCFICT